MNVLIINAIAYVVVFFFFLIKRRKLDLFLAIWMSYTVTAVFGPVSVGLGYHYSMLPTNNSISIVPFICSFFTYFLLARLFKDVDLTKFEFVQIDSKPFKLMAYGALFLFLGSTIVTFMAVQIASSIGFGEAYSAKEETGSRLVEFSNPILYFFYNYVMGFRVFLLPYTVYFFMMRLVKEKGSLIFNILALIICFLPQLFGAMAGGSKGGLFFLALQLLFYYLLFLPLFSRKLKRLLLLMGVGAGLLLLTYATAIQEGRNEYSNNKKEASEVMIRYLGEASPNLGILYNEVKWHPMGSRFFQFFIQKQETEYWTRNVGTQMAFLKTFWGDCYVEFGMVGSLLFVLFFYLFWKKCIISRYQRFYYFPLVYLCYYYCIYANYNYPIESYGAQRGILFLIGYMLVIKKYIHSIPKEKKTVQQRKS